MISLTGTRLKSEVTARETHFLQTSRWGTRAARIRPGSSGWDHCPRYSLLNLVFLSHFLNQDDNSC